MFTRKAKGQMLEHYFNLVPYTPQATFYLGFTYFTPTASNTYEPSSSSGYSRVSFTREEVIIAGSLDAYSTENTTLSFSEDMLFPSAVTAWENLQYAVIFTSALGPEPALIHKLNPSVTCLAGNALVLRPNEFFFGIY